MSPFGLVGFGLMGQGIATCLLSRGFTVHVYDSDRTAYTRGRAHIDAALKELVRRRLLKAAVRNTWRDRLICAASFDAFAPCSFVIESVPEKLDLKRHLFRELETLVPARTILASNTSGLPISLLQRDLRNPARFIGVHWSEPAQITPFLEIIPGKLTSKRTVTLAREFGLACGKDPVVLRQDISGFVANRMMYAMMREACYLVEAGVADIETVDRAYRHDMGWWSTLAGPFRWMDLTGIPAYAAVMEDLLPKLSNQKAVPELMRQAVARDKTFYTYDKAGMTRWRKAWEEFAYDIRAVAEKYSRLNAVPKPRATKPDRPAKPRRRPTAGA